MKKARFEMQLPEDHMAAYQTQADAAGVPLSQWVRSQCESGLPDDVRDGLSEIRTRGRPAKADG